MRKLIAAAIVAAALTAPVGASAHDWFTQTACTTDATGQKDCVRVDGDTEFESGFIVTVDGDDTDPRDDGTTDGYVTVQVDRSGAYVYCEDEGGFNHEDFRAGGEEDDHNGTNEECEAPHP